METQTLGKWVSMQFVALNLTTEGNKLEEILKQKKEGAEETGAADTDSPFLSQSLFKLCSCSN